MKHARRPVHIRLVAKARLGRQRAKDATKGATFPTPSPDVARMIERLRRRGLPPASPKPEEDCQ